MRGGCVALLLMGHAYMVVLVFVCQTLVYREVTSLFSLKRKGTDQEANGRDPWSKTLNWYFFAVANYFLYGESIIYYFKVRISTFGHKTDGLSVVAACGVLGRAAYGFRDEPSVHQLLAVHPWVHGLRHVAQARLS